MIRQLRIVICLAIALAIPFSAFAEPAYKFGVVPQLAPSATAALWEPLVQYLSRQSGVTLTFQTARDLSAFEQRSGAGEFDFIYANPFHYTVVHDTVGYRAFAREAERQLRGIIVVAVDSPMQKVSELNGLQLAVPGNFAFAATLIPLKVLHSQGINVEPVVVSSHESVLLGVTRRAYPAGGTIEKMLQRSAPDVQSQLRVLWRSDPYTPHPFAAHPRVPEAVRQKLFQAMIGMAATEEGRARLAALDMKGFIATDDRDYDAVRTLNTQTGSVPK